MKPHFRDDFERLAHDIISTVLQGSRGASVPQWQLEKVADMLRAGPGVTVWPRNAAEAAQAARDRRLRRPPPLKLPVTPFVAAPVLKPPMMAIPTAKKP
jgi:hypothetical protein